ncbi:terpene synthase family protein [Nonomuraea sp. NPDC005983]|uniref:terpene synthase family protein n=1 Tax=Nonomuraea sp. NPDC005983 TaxID=3155595 RepID=UPI00339FB15E
MSGPSQRAYFDIRNDLADSLLKGSHQLAGVPEQDRGLVLRTALVTVTKAAELLRPYPALYADGESSASRLAFSCLSAAATFPRARRDQIADLGALTTILFGVDDIADSIAGEWSEDDFAAFFAELPAILSGRAPTDTSDSPVGQILTAWEQWCARFHGRPGAAVHLPHLARQLELASAAMARERAWAAGREPWPSYPDYVANGMLTILYHSWWTAALGICGPTPADAGHWASIEPATHLGASCLRLANDIRSFERERVEGKPNAVSILESTGMSTEAAILRVSAHIDELDAAFDTALADLPTELAEIAAGQRRSVSFNGRWYMARDTHAYTVQELAGDVDSHDGQSR